MRSADLTDEEIIAAVKKNGDAMTYVVANILSANRGQTVKTSTVLRRLKALERAGKVKRAHSSYARQICWEAAQ